MCQMYALRKKPMTPQSKLQFIKDKVKLACPEVLGEEEICPECRRQVLIWGSRIVKEIPILSLKSEEKNTNIDCPRCGLGAIKECECGEYKEI